MPSIFRPVFFLSILISLLLLIGKTWVLSEQCNVCGNSVNIVNKWNGGYQASIEIDLPRNIPPLDKVWFNIDFDNAVQNLDAWSKSTIKDNKRYNGGLQGPATEVNNTATTYRLKYQSWDQGVIEKGAKLMIGYVVKGKAGKSPNIVEVRLEKQLKICSSSCDQISTAQPSIQPTTQSTCDKIYQVNNPWPGGYQGALKLYVTEVKTSWKVIVQFNTPVKSFRIWYGKVTDQRAGRYFEIENLSWNGNQGIGTLSIPFIVRYDGNNSPKVEMVLFDTFVCKASASISTPKPDPTTIPPTSKTTQQVIQTTQQHTNPPTTKYVIPTTQPDTTKKAKKTTIPITTKHVTTATHPETTKKPKQTTKQVLVTTQPETTKESMQTTQKQKQTSQTPQPTTHTTPGCTPSYKYSEVLNKSLLFYEAQRSGKLPANKRIPWRGDSALGDKGINGEDLTGGYYDAGDYVKFGFPGAGAITVLAWGLIEYADGYKSAGQYQYALDAIKWGTDYFIKCHTAKYEFYGQVGNGDIDHASWGRPEDMTMQRPAYKVTKSQPGSELVGETSAALSAASIVFRREGNAAYADTLLYHAKELFDFADKYRGKYSDVISDAAKFYKSWSGYGDELTWSAAWLYRATNDQQYLTKATDFYNEFGMGNLVKEFSWDNKGDGVKILMAQITNSDVYKSHAKSACDYLSQGAPKTPKGLVFLQQWGSLRHAANVAFICLVAADIGIKPTEYRNFARNQIHYMLGDTGRSFVVGFGQNPPERPHHASSSCPNPPKTCTWNDFNNPGPNPHILYGALVGGPDANDNYADKRNDYIKNEVAIDYNAGFQSAVAGLKSLALKGNCS